jgi:serine O-acetyltransferase
MNKKFYRHLFEKQYTAQRMAPNGAISAWALNILHIFYPEQTVNSFSTTDELQAEIVRLELALAEIVYTLGSFTKEDSTELAALFFNRLPELYYTLNTDMQAIYTGDPAARSEFEVIRTYPGFYAIFFYRIAHTLALLGIPLVPRILTEHAHSITGIDIHPAASIGEYFHIDHGTGIVIGETCTIGRHVKMYQGVTLGALSVHKDMADTKRHPSVQDHVVIYSGATILGGDTTIGHNSIIGGNVWLTKSVAPYSTVYHSPTITVQNINTTL